MVYNLITSTALLLKLWSTDQQHKYQNRNQNCSPYSRNIASESAFSCTLSMIYMPIIFERH